MTPVKYLLMSLFQLLLLCVRIARLGPINSPFSQFRRVIRNRSFTLNYFRCNLNVITFSYAKEPSELIKLEDPTSVIEFVLLAHA